MSQRSDVASGPSFEEIFDIANIGTEELEGLWVIVFDRLRYVNDVDVSVVISTPLSIQSSSRVYLRLCLWVDLQDVILREIPVDELTLSIHPPHGNDKLDVQPV
jgi:hypothetical protein